MSLSNGLRDEDLREDEAAKLQASVDEINQRTGSERAKAVGIAALFLENNQNAKAFEVLQHFLNSESDLVSAYYYLGEVYENADQFDRAKEKYKVAARLASETLCAARAGLARVETDPNQKKTRLESAKADFETLQKITNDDFVPAGYEERKGDMVEKLGRLIPEADNEKGKKQISLTSIVIQCTRDCGFGYTRGVNGCIYCLPGLREEC
ncbi:tetratricopeptide repeat protein [Phormidesmis sp. 146-12]